MAGARYLLLATTKNETPIIAILWVEFHIKTIDLFPEKVRMTIHEPIPVKNYSAENINELIQKSREIMIKKTEKLILLKSFSPGVNINPLKKNQTSDGQRTNSLQNQ